MQYRQDEPKPDKIHESKGLFIPNGILYDKNLTVSEKILLTQIYWYQSDNGCYAKNEHLAKPLNIKERQLESLLTNLVKKGYLNKYNKKNRRLIINAENCVYNNLNAGSCNLNAENCVYPPPISLLDIKKIIKKNIYCEDAKKVLDYLNSIHNRNFRDTTHIKARLRQGYSIDDCKKVIDNKKADPYFIENPQYLRPTTLFCPKHFDEYLNEIPKKKKYNRELYQYDSAYRKKVDENRDKYY